MLVYRIEFARAAKRQFDKLPRDVQERLRPHVDGLATDPRPHGYKKLTGETDLYRIRIGDYRLIYQIREGQLLVLVVKVGHRRDVYR